MSSHWLPNVERRGLGGLVVCINHIALIVADVGRSTTFYTDVLGLQQIQRPSFDRHGAWLTAGNVELHLIKGTPLVHTGENLIVNHIALDLKDPEAAFRRLEEMKVPFEVNVSVPKGKGKAESEGGASGNTLSQAFLRDPDGYYIELCNCDILTDFALGRTSGLQDAYGSETLHDMAQNINRTIPLWVVVKMVVCASRARKRCTEHCVSKNIKIKAIPVKDQPTEPEVHILSNFKNRRVVYGDICQSFSDEELQQILLEAGNKAPEALLLMQNRIMQGHKRIFVPPAYYVEGYGRTKYAPQAFDAVMRRSSKLSIMTAGIAKLVLSQAEQRRHRETRISVATLKASKRFLESLNSDDEELTLQNSLVPNHMREKLKGADRLEECDPEPTQDRQRGLSRLLKVMKKSRLVRSYEKEKLKGAGRIKKHGLEPPQETANHTPQ